MKTHFNSTECAKKVTAMHQQSLHVYPPAIPYVNKKKEKDTEIDQKDKYKTVEVPLDHTDENSDKTEWKVLTFGQGTPEEWVKWRIIFDDLIEAYPLDTAEKKINMLKTLLKGDAKDRLNNIMTDQPATRSQENRYKNALKELTKHYFNGDENSWRRQRNYMRYHLFFNEDNFQGFLHRLKELNKYLKYFPVPTGRTTVTSLQDDELVEILDRAKPIKYQQALLTANYDPYSKTLEQYAQYLERLEASAKIEAALTSSTKSTDNSKQGGKGKGKKRGRDDSGNNNQSDSKPTCKLCK